MQRYSTRAAAKELNISFMTLMRYIKANKIPAPKSVPVGGARVRAWAEADVEKVRKVLPKIKNGRKTRYQKKKESVARNQKSGKTTTKTRKKESAVRTQKSGKTTTKTKKKK